MNHKELTDDLWYDISTGNFWWLKQRVGRGKPRNLNAPAGYQKADGYYVIRYNNKQYSRARLAWFYMTKTWPDQVDHKNHCVSDDRWFNLRLATTNNNNQNRRSWGYTSSYKGVYFDVKHQKYKASIQINKRRIRLGSFLNEKEAAKAYNNVAKLHHGQFAVLNEV